MSQPMGDLSQVSENLRVPGQVRQGRAGGLPVSQSHWETQPCPHSLYEGSSKSSRTMNVRTKPCMDFNYFCSNLVF